MVSLHAPLIFPPFDSHLMSCLDLHQYTIEFLWQREFGPPVQINQPSALNKQTDPSVHNYITATYQPTQDVCCLQLPPPSICFVFGFMHLRDEDLVAQLLHHRTWQVWTNSRNACVNVSHCWRHFVTDDCPHKCDLFICLKCHFHVKVPQRAAGAGSAGQKRKQMFDDFWWVRSSDCQRAEEHGHSCSAAMFFFSSIWDSSNKCELSVWSAGGEDRWA